MSHLLIFTRVSANAPEFLCTPWQGSLLNSEASTFRVISGARGGCEVVQADNTENTCDQIDDDQNLLKI